MIGKLFALIPTPYKIVAGIAAVAIVAGALGYVHHRIDRGGYDRCQAEHTAAVQAAKDQAQANVIKVEKEYERRLEDLRALPDNDSLVGPITSRALDGLR